MIKHYIIKDKVQNVKCNKKLLNSDYIIPDVYKKYRYNEHHWTCDYVWQTFLPKLLHDFCISFNPDDFIKIRYSDESGQNDLSYHIPRDDSQIQYVNFDNNENIYLTISQLRKYDSTIPTTSKVTRYHSLFYGAHQTILLRNKQAKTDRKLILNTDSFSILVVPILIVYFNEILVLDNRKHISHKQIIKNFDSTDYICLMSDYDYLNNKHVMNLR